MEPETVSICCTDCGCVNDVEIVGGLKCPECDSENVFIME